LYRGSATGQTSKQRSTALDYRYSRTTGSEMSAVLGIEAFASPENGYSAGPGSARRASRASRIDPNAVSWAVRLAEAAGLLGSGMLALEPPSLWTWPRDLTPALAAIAIIALTSRAPSGEGRLLADISHRHVLRHLAFGALRILVPFLSTLALVAALFPGDSPE